MSTTPPSTQPDLATALSERGVERHVTAIFGKLGLAATPQDHRRVQAVLVYLRGA